MEKIVSLCLRVSILSYAILHFTTIFMKVEVLEQLLSVAGVLMFIFTFLYVTIAKFKLPIFILTAGITILIFSDTSILEGIRYGMIQMRGIIGLLIVIPLISWVLREEPYIEDIMALFSNFINTSRKFYFSIVSFTQVIAYFLLFGSIPMMHQFVNIILKDQTSEAWENYKGTALLRGFALSTMWVISIPSFIFAVETLGASLWFTIIQGMVIAFFGTIMAVVFSHFQEKSYGVELTPVLQAEIAKSITNASSKDVRVKKVIEFSLLFITLFGTILILHAVFDIKLMVLIPIVILFWVVGFYAAKRRINKLPTVFEHYFTHDLTKQAYQLNIMLTVGVLIYGLNQTNFSTIVVSGLNYSQEIFPFINVLYLLPFIIIFLGFIGLGPLTVMVLVAGILESMSFPYPPELIVLAVTSGSVLSILLSPLIMPVIVLSSANGLSLFTNGVKFNWKYAIAFYVLVQIYLQTAAYLI